MNNALLKIRVPIPRRARLDFFLRANVKSLIRSGQPTQSTTFQVLHDCPLTPRGDILLYYRCRYVIFKSSAKRPGLFYLRLVSNALMSRLLVCLLALSLAGCGVFGSDGGSSPSWTGDWRVIEDFAGETPRIETYWSYSEDRYTIFRNDPGSGCDIFSYEIVEVDGRDIRVDFSGDLETQRLTVSDEELTVEFVRANSPDVEGSTVRATSVSESPRKLLGCEAAKAATFRKRDPPTRPDR